MKLAIYIVSILVFSSGLMYGILGNLDTAVSYKFEIDDPTVESTINRKFPINHNSAFDQLEQKRIQLERQELFFTGLIIFSIIGLVLLFLYQKRILRIK